MSGPDRHAHWQGVYTSKGESEVSWFEESPEVSLRLLRAAGLSPSSRIVDIGGGASRLVDALLAEGLRKVAVLDLSAAALETARARIGTAGDAVEWIVSDVTQWRPAHAFDFWHDRAAFHFLTDPRDQSAYVRVLRAALAPGGIAVIGTFAPDGPEKCSGLPIVRHDAASLAALLGEGFELLTTMRHDHATPWGALQHFQFSSFRRVA